MKGYTRVLAVVFLCWLVTSDAIRHLDAMRSARYRRLRTSNENKVPITSASPVPAHVQSDLIQKQIWSLSEQLDSVSRAIDSIEGAAGKDANRFQEQTSLLEEQRKKDSSQDRAQAETAVAQQLSMREKQRRMWLDVSFLAEKKAEKARELTQLLKAKARLVESGLAKKMTDKASTCLHGALDTLAQSRRRMDAIDVLEADTVSSLQINEHVDQAAVHKKSEDFARTMLWREKVQKDLAQEEKLARLEKEILEKLFKMENRLLNFKNQREEQQAQLVEVASKKTEASAEAQRAHERLQDTRITKLAEQSVKLSSALVRLGEMRRDAWDRVNTHTDGADHGVLKSLKAEQTDHARRLALLEEVVGARLSAEPKGTAASPTTIASTATAAPTTAAAPTSASPSSSTGSGSSTAKFSPVLVYPTGPNTLVQHLYDLNSDGHPDLSVIHSIPSSGPIQSMVGAPNPWLNPALPQSYFLNSAAGGNRVMVAPVILTAGGNNNGGDDQEEALDSDDSRHIYHHEYDDVSGESDTLDELHQSAPDLDLPPEIHTPPLRRVTPEDNSEIDDILNGNDEGEDDDRAHYHFHGSHFTYHPEGEHSHSYGESDVEETAPEDEDLHHESPNHADYIVIRPPLDPNHPLVRLPVEAEYKDDYHRRKFVENLKQNPPFPFPYSIVLPHPDGHPGYIEPLYKDDTPSDPYHLFIFKQKQEQAAAAAAAAGGAAPSANSADPHVSTTAFQSRGVGAPDGGVGMFQATLLEEDASDSSFIELERYVAEPRMAERTRNSVTGRLTVPGDKRHTVEAEAAGSLEDVFADSDRERINSIIDDVNRLRRSSARLRAEKFSKPNMVAATMKD